jgi:flavodoxin
MHSVLILWAPDTAENRRVVEAIVGAFDGAKLNTLAKKVGEATLADITAADIVVFGAQKAPGSDLPADYSEFMRAFKGITLAGRTAGFFSTGNERATARLRKSLKDAEITQLEDDPLFPDQKPGPSAEVAEWARRLVELHQEKVNAHA